MTYRLIAAAALAAALTAPAHAATVFSDNFDANAPGSNTTPAGWTVSNGSVELVGPGFYDMLPGNGSYVDLDGSTNDAGVLAKSFTGLANGVYQVSFDLAGSQRGSQETVSVDFGGTLGSYTLASSDYFGSHSLTAVVTNGTLTLSFDNGGFDNVGALLDNVVITTAVPEPGTGAMLMAGLAIVGGLTRRRRV